MPGSSENDTKTGVMVVKSGPQVLIGGLEHFDIQKPASWTPYLQRFNSYIACNDIQPHKRASTLITVGGPDLYETMASLAAPDQVCTLEYDRLCTLLNDFFVPRKSVWMERFTFCKRMQGPDESAAQFMAQLQRLSNHCNFGTMLDSMLITQFIVGLKNEGVQRRLLRETESALTKKLALETATATECAAEHIVFIKHESGMPESVKAVAKHPAAPTGPKCGCCGLAHDPPCRYSNLACRRCQQKGHLERVCKSAARSSDKSKNQRDSTRRVNNVTSVEASVGQRFASIGFGKQVVRFEVDSGSPYTIISEKLRKRILPNVQLTRGRVHLTDYQGGTIVVRGEVRAEIVYNGRAIKNLPLIIVDCNADAIVGRNWFSALGIRLEGVHAVADQSNVAGVIKEFEDVFSTSLGVYKGPPVTLQLNEGTQPKCFRPRIVPMALRAAVEEELQKLVQQGVLTRMEYSDWATPIVPVKKTNGSIRICGDYKSTVNQCIKAHAHKVPSVNDLLSRMDGGKIFAKLDMAQAYQQLAVDGETAKIQAIATHKGTFAVNRLQFGIASAPGIFQSLMERLLGGLEGVMPYFDDIIVVAVDERDLARKLKLVLQVFATNGLRLRKDKCVFKATRLEFLGHQVGADGISAVEDKVASIQKAPLPTNKKELQAFLGMIGFYQPFLKDKATLAEPLHRLLDKKATWTWERCHTEAVNKLKNLLSSKSVLLHYSLNRPLGVVADASPYGVGAVLFHTMEDGSERPVAYYSRTLSAAERNYSQTDRESVAIVSAVKKWHTLLYGRRFQIYSDHRPLLGILGAGVCPEMISPNMLRRRIFLSAYDAVLHYRQGSKMGNADFLSRAPAEGEKVQFIDHKQDVASFTSRDMAMMTKKDSVLQVVHQYAREGWPVAVKLVPEEIRVYFAKRDEISSQGDCLLWGHRIIVPASARADMLKALHVGHPGIVKMKTLARQHVYWPGMDEEIAQLVGRCTACQETRADPPKTVHPWEHAEKPWSRIHIDHAGPFRNRLFLIVSDAYSRWYDVSVVSSTASSPTIARLRELFATHGLPDTIVSDNGRGFVSAEFEKFCSRNAIEHYRVAAYMASSNGLAERTVQTCKNFLKKIRPGDDVGLELAAFLLGARTTSLPGGKSPSELLMGRRVETYFDKLRPKKTRQFKEGKFKPLTAVWARTFSGNSRSWGRGQILRQVGYKVFMVELDDGTVHRRHEQQLRRRVVEDNSDDETVVPETQEQPLEQQVDSEEESEYGDAEEEAVSSEPVVVQLADRPKRIRKQTSFYKA